MLQKTDAPVLVTGATGFLGSHIVAQLAAAGATVIAVDIEEPPTPVLGLWVDERQKIRQMRCDARDEGALRSLIENFEPWAVIHAAAVTNAQSKDQLARMYDVNVRGSESVFSAAEGRRLVFISSASVYQASADDSSVYSELNAPVVASSEISPPIDYAATKRLGELLVQKSRSAGNDYRIARVAACFGPIEHPTVGRHSMSVGRRMAEAVRDGYYPEIEYDARIDLTYVADSARGVLAILVADDVHDITNVASGEAVRLTELAQMFWQGGRREKTNGLEARTRPISLPSGARHGVLDVRRLADLGFEPADRLSQSILTYLNWLDIHDY